LIKVFITFLLFYFCTLIPAEAAITRGVGPVNNDNLTNQIVTVLPGTTVGGMLVIVIGYSGLSGPVTISSATVSGEVDMTRVTAFNMTSVGDSFAIFYLPNNTGGGSKTITITFSDNAYFSSIAQEYLGQDTTTQPDATTSPTSGALGSGTDPTISITTATAGDLIITVCSDNGGKPTMPSGYSDLNLSNPGYYANAADNVAAGAVGSKTLIWADVNNYDWGVSAVAFKAAAVAGPTSVRHSVIGQ
jgi:hypothetical protein